MNAQTAAAAIATAVSLACTVVVALRARDRAAIRAPLIAWTIAFGLFTIADAALWYGAARGWTAPVFRLYYLTGGILVVAYLAVGELLLVLPGRRVARVTAATMLFLTFAAISGVLAAQVDDAKLAAAGAAPPNGALVGTPPVALAIVLNSVGTVVVLVGSVLSARRRRDWRPLLVAAGVGVVALTASATRLGSYTLFALGQALGVILIFLGLVTRRSSGQR
jgi:hypothetical protein